MLKILYTTKQTQGDRPNDFFWGKEGDLALLELMPHTGQTADGTCGCARSLGGATSYQAATTFVVGEYLGTRSDFEDAYYDSLEKGGWLKPITADMLPHEQSILAFVQQTIDIPTFIRQSTDTILAACTPYPVGTIMERCDEGIVPRTITSA